MIKPPSHNCFFISVLLLAAFWCDAQVKDWSKHNLQGKWYGNIGKKNFILNLENVSNSLITGYNIAGNNKRPVTGSFTFDKEHSKYTLNLKEPGNDKWDGVFELEFSGFSDEWFGEGKWKSFNGQVINNVSLSRKPPDNPKDFIAAGNSSNPADRYIGIWLNDKRDEVKISKKGKNYNVNYHPFQDYDFDMNGYYLNNKIKCATGQNNKDTTEITLLTNNQIKFEGEWDAGHPGKEIYYFNKK